MSRGVRRVPPARSRLAAVLAGLRNTVSRVAEPEAEPQVEERRVAEVWTFERTLGASDPNWLLARTEPATA